MLTEDQNAMLTAIEAHCHLRDMTAWVGSPSDLEKIGGQDLLYELEQAGVVTFNRLHEKWIISPNRKEK